MVQQRLLNLGTGLAQAQIIKVINDRRKSGAPPPPPGEAPAPPKGCPWCQAFDALVVAREHLILAGQKPDPELRGVHLGLALQAVRDATSILERPEALDHPSGVGPAYAGRARVIFSRLEASKLDHQTLELLSSLIIDCNQMAEGGPEVPPALAQQDEPGVIMSLWQQAQAGDSEARARLRAMLEEAP